MKKTVFAVILGLLVIGCAGLPDSLTPAQKTELYLAEINDAMEASIAAYMIFSEDASSESLEKVRAAWTIAQVYVNSRVRRLELINEMTSAQTEVFASIQENIATLDSL